MLDINELRESMNAKSDDELLGILTRRELYSPVQIDIVIEILKNRREGGRPLGSTPIQPKVEETPVADDPTALFKPEEVKQIIEKSEEIKKEEHTAELPKVSEEYISHQKSAKPEKKKANKGVVIASVISGVIILLVVLGLIFRPGIGLFKSKFESGNYESAQFFYKWCKGGVLSGNKLNDYFTETAVTFTDDYLEGKIAYEEAEEKISAIKYFDSKLGEKLLEELKNAGDAENFFAEGTSLMEMGQYYDAILSFTSIYEGYKKYDLVAEKLEECRVLLKEDLEEKMQEWLENHDFAAALEYVEKIKDAFGDDPIITSYEDAIAEQLEAQEVRNKSAEDFYDKGGSADSSFRDVSGLTYPSKKILTWDETGSKAVIEYGTVGSKSQLAFAVFADIGNGIQQIYSYQDAYYNIYQGTITVADGVITITGKINSNGGYTDVSYTLKFDGEKAYLG